MTHQAAAIGLAALGAGVQEAAALGLVGAALVFIAVRLARAGTAEPGCARCPAPRDAPTGRVEAGIRSPRLRVIRGD